MFVVKATFGNSLPICFAAVKKERAARALQELAIAEGYSDAVVLSAKQYRDELKANDREDAFPKKFY